MKTFFQFAVLLATVFLALYSQTYFNSYLTFAVTLLVSYASGMLLKRLRLIVIYLLFPLLLVLGVFLNYGSSTISLDFQLFISLFIFLSHWVTGVFLSTRRVNEIALLGVFVLTYSSQRVVHLVDENTSQKEASLKAAAVFADLRMHFSEEPATDPKRDFFLFTWNQRCGQCKKLARDIATIPKSEKLPIYPTHVSFSVQEDFKNLPEEIYAAAKDSNHLLDAKQSSMVFKDYQAAPVIFYKTSSEPLTIIHGYQNQNKELIRSIVTQKPRSTIQQIFPDIFLYEGPLWVYLAGIVLIFLKQQGKPIKA